MEWLIRVDKYVFSIINNKWHNAFFDTLMPFFRSSFFWLPFYFFLLVLIIINFKNGWWFVLFAVCTISLTDLISSHMIKQIIMRVRPCHDPDLAGMMQLIERHCPQSSGFPSPAAANHFGLATYISIVLYPSLQRWIYISYFLAFAIIYAQVYVGMHYPLDILAGALIGVLAGLLTAWVFKYKVDSFNLLNLPTQ